MAEVNISINGRNYDIACDRGQEGRIIDLAAYIDQKVKEIASSGAAFNDSHLLVLTSLILADELFEVKNSDLAQTTMISGETAPVNEEEQAELVNVIENLAKKINGIATKIEKAA